MRAADVVHVVWSGGYGGTERHVQHLVRASRTAGRLEHRAVFLDGRGEVAEAMVVADHADRLNFRSGMSLRQLGRLGLLLRRLRPSVVHFHTRSLGAHLVARLVARRAALVYTEHAPGALERRRKFRIFYRLFGPGLDLVIAIAPAVRRCLASYGVPEPKIVDLPHAVDARNARLAPTSSASPMTVGVVARLERQKRVDTLIQIVARLRQDDSRWRGLIVGDGSERESLEQLAVELQVRDSVDFVGSQADVYAFLERMGYFVMTSSVEPLGITALEAMSAGVPVVAMPSTGGLSDLVRAGGLLLESRSVDQAARAITEVQADPGLRASLCARGRRAAEGRNYDSLVTRLEGAYASVSLRARAASSAGSIPGTLA